MTRVDSALALAPFLGLLGCMLTHLVVSRSLPRLPRLHGIGLSAVAGFAAVAGILLVASRGPAPPTVAVWELAAVWLLTYLLLTYCYIIGFFNLGESARRIRLLIELYGAGERGMDLGEILAVYNARMIVEARLQRLLSSGQIMKRDGQYFVKRRLMLYVAKILAQLKIVLLPRRRRVGVRSPRG